MDFNVLKNLLNQLSSTAKTEDLITVKNYLNEAIERTIKKEEILLSKVPVDFKFPAYIMMTNEEALMIDFLEEVFNNFGEDYRVGNPEVTTNDNSINITTSFNQLYEKEGQFPLIVVEALATQSQFLYLSNINEKGKTSFVDENTIRTKTHKSAEFTIPMRISVVSANKNESNILANCIQFALIENMDMIRHFFKMKQVTFPQVQAAQQIDKFQDLFMASVNFTVIRNVSWVDVFKVKRQKEFYLRLRAKYGEDDPSPIVAIVAKIKDETLPFFSKYFAMLEKALGKK